MVESKTKLYSNLLSTVKELVDNDLKKIKDTNYVDILKEFGYSFEKMNNENLDNQNKVIDDLKGISGLYVFREMSDNKLNEDLWSRYTKNNKMISIPKWQSGKVLNSKKIFYLGKSNNLKTRICQHLNKDTSPKTSALRLNRLSEQYEQFKYSIDIFFLDNSSEARAINELVESVLHRHLHPTIGTSRK